MNFDRLRSKLKLLSSVQPHHDEIIPRALTAAIAGVDTGRVPAAFIAIAICNRRAGAMKTIGLEQSFMDLQVEADLAIGHLAFNVGGTARKLLAFRADGNLRLPGKLRADPEEVRHRLDRAHPDHLCPDRQPQFPTAIRLWLRIADQRLRLGALNRVCDVPLLMTCRNLEYVPLSSTCQDNHTPVSSRIQESVHLSLRLCREPSLGPASRSAANPDRYF